MPLNRTDKDLSDLLQNANDNYGKYHELAVKYRAWQKWYKSQQRIFEEAQ